MKKNCLASIFLLVIFFYSSKLNAQCIMPASANVVTTVSTCINNGSITVNNVTGGSLDSTGINPLTEYSIVASDNPSQPLITWQNDSVFNNIYPGDYTVAIRFNCGASGNGYSDSLTEFVTVAGSYQLMSAIVSDEVDEHCNDGSFVINASNGYIGVTGQYTYQLVSSQNATQPDPGALSLVQTSDTFNNLVAGTYYVRIFDDCGSFITQSVVINHLAPSPVFFDNGNSSNQPFIDSFINCSTHKYKFKLLQFDFGASLSYKYPITIYFNLPGGNKDSIIYANASDLWAGLSNWDYVDISSYVQSGLLSTYSQTMIDACGNTRYSDSFQIDTGNFNFGFQGSTITGCSSYIQYNNYLYTNSFTDSFITTGYYKSYVYLQGYQFDISPDGGVTWQPSQDTLQLPYNTVNKIFFRVCGQVDSMMQYIPANPFSPKLIQGNDNACLNLSGLSLSQNGQLGMGDIDSLHFTFTSIPAGQPSIPVVNYGGYALTDINSMMTYFNNMLPGKYVYTATNECGQTYTDSVTIAPHIFSFTAVPVLNCNNQNTIVATTAGTPVNGGFLIDLKNGAGGTLQLPQNLYNTTQSFNNLPYGTYIVRIYPEPLSPSFNIFNNNDSLICPLADTVVIVNPGALSIASSLFVSCGGTIGTIIANATGGIAPYTYELYNGTVSPANLITTQSSPSFAGLNSSQTYNIRVIDNCGTGAAISKSFSPYAAVVRQLGSACLNNNLTLYADTVTGATYSWTKNGSPLSDTTNSINFPSLSTSDYGTYAVTVTIAGCAGFSASRTISASLCMPLPVQLIEFTAIEAGNKSRLDWVTSTEINNTGFAIERSTDGINWQQIGFVASKAINNNSTQQLSYTWYDNNPLSGINYYRLKQIDIDGSSNYSDIETVNIGNNDKISVQPNPVTDKLYIITNNCSDIKEIKLLDETGRIIYQIANAKDGINMNSFATGMYMLQIIKNNSDIQTEKIIKK